MSRFAVSILVLALSTSASAACQRHTPVQFGTPVQRLDEGLQDFAHKTGCPVTVDMALLAGLKAGAVPGQRTPAQALNRMLRRSGLQFRADHDGYAISIWRP